MNYWTNTITTTQGYFNYLYTWVNFTIKVGCDTIGNQIFGFRL